MIRTRFTPEEVVAKALTFLASDETRMGAFFQATGACADTIRASAKSPVFAEVVLDYVLESRELLLGLEYRDGLSASEIAMARMMVNAPAPTEASREERRQPPRPPVGAAPAMARRFALVEGGRS